MFDVAVFPSSTPARAASDDPVHTVNRCPSLGNTSLMKAIAARITGVDVCAPKPPGMINTSRSFGGSAKVCVGTIVCAKLEPAGSWTAAAGGLVVTGSSVAAMIESVMPSV